ncbi:MAG: rod shape-determining protein MreB [Planctomycetota bacterium]|jgi:rod shape-determining protein MreB
MVLKKAKRLVESFLRHFERCLNADVGIDLGTCNTVISLSDKGIVLDEPSVVAVKNGTSAALNNNSAIGSAAHEMLGKTPGSIRAIRPLRDGVISDFDATEAMLVYFMKKAQGKSRRFTKPQVAIAVPSGITQVERRAVIETAERAGARKVYLLDEPMAAGIGAGLPVRDPTASMIVDIGGGTTEVAIISLADIACCDSIPVGGDAMDEAIINYLKKTHNLVAGQPRAERVKIEIGSAGPLDEELTMEVSGRDMVTGMPKTITIDSTEIREALKELILAITDAVTGTIERAKPELVADLIDNGIHICGGGSLLRELDTVLADATGLRVIRVDDPLKSVARGTSIYLENPDVWNHRIPYSESKTSYSEYETSSPGSEGSYSESESPYYESENSYAESESSYSESKTSDSESERVQATRRSD